MLREFFLGKVPSQFTINPIVKSFIISECFLWAGWNFITPIFAIFATTEIINGRIELAASAYSTHLIFRVIFELITGRFLTKGSDKKMFYTSIVGILILSIAYLGFSITHTIFNLFFFYSMAGIGFGIASPAKNTLFSNHLDKNKESLEWSITDAFAFIAIAFAATLGGFIASNYGFRTLFILSSAINAIAIIPYSLYLRNNNL